MIIMKSGCFLGLWKLLICGVDIVQWSTFKSFVLRHLVIASICNIMKLPEVRACLHGGGGPQVGEVTRLGVVSRLTI